MKDVWKAAMHEAARLTRAGRIGDATGLIAKTLSGSAAASRSVPGGDSTRGGAIEGEYAVIQDPARPQSSGSEDADWSWGSFENDLGARDYRLFVPPSGPGADVSRPLIVMLHGCTQEPDDFAASTRMNALAAQFGCYLLYPAQSVAVNANRCWGWYELSNQRRDQGEPGIIAAMVRHFIQTRPIDARRVYVAGLSAGGAMAAILAALYPGLFAAVGVHSGLPVGAAHDLMSALMAMRQGGASDSGAHISIPLIVFQGESDTTVNPLNVVGLIAQAGFDAGAAGEGAVESGRSPGGYAYRRTSFLGEDGRCRAELWSVEDLGHGWSGGSAACLFSDPRGPDASREMMRFFLGHPGV